MLGAYIMDCTTGEVHAIAAKAVILATGGAGKVYRYTTNLRLRLGMAWRWLGAPEPAWPTLSLFSFILRVCTIQKPAVF